MASTASAAPPQVVPQVLDPSDSSEGSDSDVEVHVEEVPQMMEKPFMQAPTESSHGAVADGVSTAPQETLEVAAPIFDGLLDEEPAEPVKPRTFSKEEDDECRRFWESVGSVPPGIRRKLTQIKALAKSVPDKLEEATQGFTSRPEDAVVVAVFKAARDETVGQSLESRLDASEDDLRRLCDMPPETMSRLKLGVVDRCQRLAKTLAVTASEQTVSNKKNGKKRSAGEVSFKDRIEGMEAAAKRVKTELVAMVGRPDLELGWFDAPPNLKHMTLVDVEAFKRFFEETIAEFEVDANLQGTDVKEKFGKILHDIDKHDIMGAVFVTEYGKGFDVARGDHLEYRRLLKAKWLRRMRAE